MLREQLDDLSISFSYISNTLTSTGEDGKFAEKVKRIEELDAAHSCELSR